MYSKISVIVPVYKVEKYLNRCVDSILNQTFKDFELILVDDGSPDKCPKMCDEYAKKDSRIHVIHKENGGVSLARNVGIEYALKSNSEYISFIDSDDWIDKDYLEVLWNERTDLTLFAHTTYDEKGVKLYDLKYDYKEYNSREEIDFVYLCNKLFSPYCRLFRSDIIFNNKIRFPIDISWGEDAIFGGIYSQFINTVKVLPYSGYHYIKYNFFETLSSKIKFDIIDTITKSREIYLSFILQGNGKENSLISQTIKEDICWNCVFFINKLFLLKNIKATDKKKLFYHFRENKYVLFTIKNKRKYYTKKICVCLKYKNPFMLYSVLSNISRIKNIIKKIIFHFSKD